MPNIKDFKELAKQHLKTAETLMDAKDWAGSAYMMGYVLEFILKASACKSLNLVSYPETHNNEKVYSFFKAHNFDQLQMISGVIDLFDARGSANAQQNWSDFTAYYLGDWTGMRYNKDIRKQFSEKVVKKLYTNLYDGKDSIIKVIEKKKRC